VLSAVTRLSAILLLVHFERLGVQELIWVEIVTTATTVTVLLLLTRDLSLPRFATVRFGNVKRLLRFSAPLFANDVFTYFYNGMTLLLLGALLSPSSVAMFAVASKIPDAMERLFLSMSVVYFPSMSQLMASGRREEGRQLMNLILVLITTGLSFVALATYFFQQEILLILFSEQYIEAAPLLALLMLSFLLTCTGQLMGFTSVADGHASVPLRVNVIKSVISFFACLYLIPLWGALGAVAGQLLANSVTQVVYWQLLNRMELMIQVRDIAKPLLLGFGIMALYELSGSDYRLFRILLLGVFIVLCWFLVPGIRRCFAFGFEILSNRIPGLRELDKQ
jgi:O-antigen/teichoic acid export membrane protein